MKLSKIAQNLFVMMLTVSLANCCFAVDETNEAKEVIKVSLSEDGKIKGQVYTMLDNQKAPLVGKVSLTADGKTLSTSDTDDEGNFAFEDVEPGTYNAIGVAGDFVGDQEIEVTESEGEYTAIPLAVAQSGTAGIYESYSSLPASSFSAAPSVGYSGGYSVGGCSTCSGGSHSYGRSVSTCGGGCGSCGSCGGGGLFSGGGSGLNFRRLALIGGIVGIAVGVSSNPASPDE